MNNDNLNAVKNKTQQRRTKTKKKTLMILIKMKKKHVKQTNTHHYRSILAVNYS